MLPSVGSIVFVNGNQAAIVIHVDDAGNLIVAHFAGSEEIEAGDYGIAPGVKAENRPSFVPEGGSVTTPTTGEPVTPFAGAPRPGDTEAPVAIQG